MPLGVYFGSSHRAPVDTLVERIELTHIEPFFEGEPSLDEIPIVAEVSRAMTEFIGDRCPRKIPSVLGRPSSIKKEGHVSARDDSTTKLGARGRESSLCRVHDQIGSCWGAVGFPTGATRVHVGA